MERYAEYSFLIPLFPLIGAAISGFFGARWLKGQSHWPVWIGLTYIYGIGRSRSQDILVKAEVPTTTKVRDLTEDEARRIRKDPSVDYLGGQAFTIFVLVIAAAEASLALGLVVLLFRQKNTLDADAWRELRG